jgi:chemotaxis protein MotB
LDIDTARTVLEKISLLLTKTELSDKQVRIEGHTDKGPTDPDGPWETNWDLAAERSLNVLKYLIDFGVNPANLAAVSYGEYQPIPLLNDDTEEGMARNRRVDVLILRD